MAFVSVPVSSPLIRARNPDSQSVSPPVLASASAAAPLSPSPTGTRPPSRPEARCRPRSSRPGWAVSWDQAELPGPCGGLGAVGGTQLAQDMGHVLLDRVERHEQIPGDVLV